MTRALRPVFPSAPQDEDVMRGLGGTEDKITVESAIAAIRNAGILYSADPRLASFCKSLSALDKDVPLSKEEFFEAVSHNLSLLHRIATGEMAISDFAEFSHHLDHLKTVVEPDTSGSNADYIPILRDAPSDKLGVAFCSVDGQFYESGDSRDPFSIQSTSKPLTFALALEKLGDEGVRHHVGIEPSGRKFNDSALLDDNRPYNPMVNSGALMTAAALASVYPEYLKRDSPKGPDGVLAEELCQEVLLPVWKALSGNGIVGDIGFSEETFLSERETAATNKSIAYLLSARKGLPKGVSEQTMLDFYLRACSITANTASMAVVAATLANGGRNPITGDQVFSVDVVKKTLSVLSFCGFYDNAGEFFYLTGLPSKSGVSGVVFLVLPNVGGFAVFSPRLDAYGNSVRGSAFAKKLVDLFTFHSFDNLSSLSTGCKLDPRFSCDFAAQRNIDRLRWAVRAGGMQAQKFDDLLVNVCLLVAQVDGVLEQTEVQEMMKIYLSVMHVPLNEDRVKRILKDITHLTGAEALADVHRLVSAEERAMNDTEKHLLIEASTRIATADGVVREQEREILETISKALKVDPLVMDVRIKSWEREKMS